MTLRNVAAAAGLLLLCALPLRAQAPDGMLTQTEVEQLRDAAYVPLDRVRVYMRILDDRVKELDAIMAKRHGVDFPGDVHDVIDQIGSIADELNDNLDSYAPKHRDLRKVLPKLTASAQRWSTALRAPADDPRYNVVRQTALDALKDTQQIASDMAAEQEAYFKAHPEAAKEEKARANDPHAPQ